MKTDYFKQYIEFVHSHSINKSDNLVQTYAHHVLPRALGGKNDSNNIVKLTYLDHVKAHELLFKAYYSFTLTLAHAIVSMAGSENVKDKDVLYLDKIKDTDVKLDAAYKAISKRTVYDRRTMKQVRIPCLSETPADCIDMLPGKKTLIIDYACFKDTGKIIRFFWNKDQPLPADNWKFVSDLSVEDKMKIWPQAFIGKTTKGSVRWIHNNVTHANKLVPIDGEVEEGWTEGMYISAECKAKMRAGGFKSAAKMKFADGSRWIHNVSTHKNKLIAKTDSLPNGFAEGMYDKRFAEYEAKIRSLEAKLSDN